MSFTPGPWTVKSEPDGPDAGGKYIRHYIEPRVADVFHTNETGAANARLIAAAPDLLIACEASLNDRMFKDWPEVAALLKDAIAKARGE